ncbi:hypothetical protein KJ966_19810 [bacterium]|nr:hypothetical protein [bacterium]
MKSKIKWNHSDEYELAITQWLIKYLKEKDIKETHFSRDAGLGKSDTDARTFRKLKEGNRHWSIIDICKLANYFDESPSVILSRVEEFYENEGIVIPGKTVERILDLGFNQDKNPPTLISTWQKKGKSFIFMDCDPDWKKVATNVIQRIVGMNSKQIFPYYPEVTESFERAWKLKGEDKISIEYQTKSNIEKALLKSDDEQRMLRINSKFVPPDYVVAYVDDITEL